MSAEKLVEETFHFELYDSNTQESWGTNLMTREEADKQNAQLRRENDDRRWIPVREPDEEAPEDADDYEEYCRERFEDNGESQPSIYH
jgi:hypothetical protein